MRKNKQNKILNSKLRNLLTGAMILLCLTPITKAYGEDTFSPILMSKAITLNKNTNGDTPDLINDINKAFSSETKIYPAINSNEEFITAPAFTPQTEHKSQYDTFTPLIETQTPENTEIKNEEDTPYYIEANEENIQKNVEIEESCINYEGLTISEINYVGLNLINKSQIEQIVQTHINTPYNEELLQADLQNIYNTGYFTDNISINQELLSNNTIQLTFELEENRPVKNVILNGMSACSPDELQNLTNQLKNKPQNISLINNIIPQIDEYYSNKGYILAKVASVDDNENGDLIFNIQEGIIDEINFEGNTKTKEYVINRNIITKTGDVYNEECIKEDLQRIYATQLFESINKNIQETEENSGKYKVTISVKESKSTNGVTLGGGIDSGIGIFGELGFFDNNFQGRAQRVSLNGIVGSGILLNDSSIKNRVNYQVELNFFEPYFLNADNSLASKLYVRELGSYNIPLAIERRIGVNTQIQHKFTDYEHLKGTFDAGVEHINLKEGDRDKIYSLYAQKGIDISERAKQLQGGFFVNLAPGLLYSNLDTNINPREGILAEVKVNETIAVGHMDKTSTRLNGSVTRFYPVAKKSSVSLTAKGGAKLVGSNMPEIFAYRLGGPYLVRGFRYNGIGSGNCFIMGSAELSTPVLGLDKSKYEFLKNLRLNFFVDAGQVFDKTITSRLYDRPMHAISIGVGLKLHIPGIGAMNIDYGLPITNVGGHNSQGGYITFGSGYFGNGW